jgi:hypothetical protein
MSFPLKKRESPIPPFFQYFLSHSSSFSYKREACCYAGVETMKIAIAINGEGRGHFSRAGALAEIFQEKFDIVFYAPRHMGAELKARFPKAAFRPIPYLAFVQKGFSIDYSRTVFSNLGLVFSSARVCASITEALRQDGVEAVLSDFEPFTSRAAKALGLPVMQLNHPGIVTRIADWSPSGIASKIVARYMMGNSDCTMLCSFFGGDVGPIVRRELREKTVTRGSRFVVYQKAMYRDFLSPVLDRLGRDRFCVFPDPENDYASALASSAGLIAPAGHQSISEALALGKPVFVIPVRGQFEQELNARKLRESGFGDYCYFEDIDARLPGFIENISRYETAIKFHREGTGEWLCRDDTHRAASMVEAFFLRRTPAPVMLPVRARVG